MGQLSRFFDSKFIGCMIVGQTHDPHRGRTVTLYALHDEPGMVGIYDGIDRWACNASTNPFGMKVSQHLTEIDAGSVFEIEQGQTMLREKDAPGVHPVPVRMEGATSATKPRRRAHTEEVPMKTIEGPYGPMLVIDHKPAKERRRANV